MNDVVVTNCSIKKNHYIVLLSFFVFFAFCEFFTFTNALFIASLPLLVVVFFFKKEITLELSFLYFAISISIAIITLLLKEDGFNGLLLIPIFSYMVARLYGKEGKENLFFLIKLLLIIALSFSVLEFLTKSNVLNFPLYKRFILDFGDQRFDVFRSRSLWGSSLSAAAIGVFFFSYFTIFKFDLKYTLLSLVFILFTGSRTAFVLLVLISFSLFIINGKTWRASIKKTTLLFLVFIFISFYSFIYFFIDSILGKIFSRAFLVTIDKSVLGRADTSGDVLQRLFESLPGSLFWGIDGQWISDSAFTSIGAKSGILALLIYIIFYIFSVSKMGISYFKKFLIVFSLLLGGSMIGDYLIPAVSYLYFLTFFIYRK